MSETGGRQKRSVRKAAGIRKQVEMKCNEKKRLSGSFNLGDLTSLMNEETMCFSAH